MVHSSYGAFNSFFLQRFVNFYFVFILCGFGKTRGNIKKDRILILGELSLLLRECIVLVIVCESKQASKIKAMTQLIKHKSQRQDQHSLNGHFCEVP